MDEIQDLKNHILGLTHKIDSILKFIDTLKFNNNRINEMLDVIHGMSHERSRQHNIVFENIFPDIIRRINNLEKDKDNDNDKNLKLSIKALVLSKRTINSLLSQGIETLGHLIDKKEYELTRIPNFGRRSLDDVKKTLKEYNLELKK